MAAGARSERYATGVRLFLPPPSLRPDCREFRSGVLRRAVSPCSAYRDQPTVLPRERGPGDVALSLAERIEINLAEPGEDHRVLKLEWQRDAPLRMIKKVIIRKKHRRRKKQ
jgi:hypothetical protein